MKLKNSAYLLSSRLVGMAISFVTVPLFLRWSGSKDAYGVIVLAFSWTGYTNLLDLGYPVGAQKYLVEAVYDQEHERAQRLQRCGIAVAGLASLVGLLVLIVLGLILPAPGSTRENTFTILTLIGISAMASNFGNVLNLAALAYEKYALSTTTGWVRDLLTNAILLTIAYIYRSAPAIAAGYAISAVAGVLLTYVMLRRSISELRFRPLWDWPLIREVGGVGFRNFPNAVIGNIANRSDRLLLGGSSLRKLTDYSNASNPVNMGSGLLGNLMSLLNPEMVRHLREDERKGADTLYRNGLILFATSCALLLVPSAGGDLFLRMWLKENTVPNGGLIMAMMGIYYANELHNLTHAALFYSKGIAQRLIGFSVYNAVATLAFTLPAFHWYGLVGIASMNLIIALSQLVPRVMTSRRALDAPFPIGNYLMRIGGILAVCTAAWFGLRQVVDLPVWRGHPWFVLLACPVVGALTLVVMFAIRLVPMPQSLANKLSRRPSPAAS